MNRTLLKAFAAGFASAAVATSIFAATIVSESVTPGSSNAADPAPGRMESRMQSRTEDARDIPLVEWSAPQFFNAPSGVTSSMPGFQAKGVTAKAALDLATFIPIAPCRLVDTRGLFSPVYAGGPFSAGQTRVYRASGNCGVLAGNDRVKAVSLAVTTPPTAASGDIEVVSEAATLGSTVVMVIQAGQWNSATTVSAVDPQGDFKVQLRGTPGDVVIDINGYYASVSQSQSDFINVDGSYSAGLFFVYNHNPAGAAIRGYNTGGISDVNLALGNNAIDIATGGIRIRNSGLNTSGAAFVHKVSAATRMCGNDAYSVIDHPDLNDVPRAIIIITPVENYNNSTGATGTNGPSATTYTPMVQYLAPGVCAPNGRWSIRRSDNTVHVDGTGFNVLVLSP
jgi:hypothetical protein